MYYNNTIRQSDHAIDKELRINNKVLDFRFDFNDANKIICTVIFVAFLCLANFSPAKGDIPKTFIKLNILSEEEFSDGLAKIKLGLSSNSKFNMENLSSYYRFCPLNWESNAGSNECLVFKSIINKPELTITVFSGEFKNVDVFAKATIAGYAYYAQASFPIVGRANLNTFNPFKNMGDFILPSWPTINTNCVVFPRVGHSCNFTPINANNSSNDMLAVFDDKDLLIDKVLPRSNVYEYIPESDHFLDGNPERIKTLYFVKALPPGGSVSLAVKFRRDFGAGIRLKPGLAVFVASVGLVVAIATVLRR
jgi:hypothetical protein